MSGLKNAYVYYGTDKISGNKSSGSLGVSGSEDAYVIFICYLPNSVYFVAKSNDGVARTYRGQMSAALNFMSVECSSLNSQLIESKLSNAEGVRTVKSLKKGMELVIGDTRWVYNGEVWKSLPIHNSANSTINRMLKTETLNNAGVNGVQRIASVFKEQLFSSMFVWCNGSSYPLSNYVEELDVGDCINSGDKRILKAGLLCRKKDSNGNYKDGVCIWKKTKTYPEGRFLTAAGRTAGYVSLHMKLNESLFVRPLNAEESVWTVVFRASMGMLSSEQYPFFDDDLAFRKTRQQFAEITSVQFSPSDAFDSIRKSFMEEFHKALAGDIWSLLWLIMLSVSSYMIIMSWFSYGVLTLGVGRFGFEALAMRSLDGKKRGIDVIKLFTFGIYSLDSDPSLGRIVTVSLACCGIVVFIVTQII